MLSTLLRRPTFGGIRLKTSTVQFFVNRSNLSLSFLPRFLLIVRLRSLLKLGRCVLYSLGLTNDFLDSINARMSSCPLDFDSPLGRLRRFLVLGSRGVNHVIRDFGLLQSELLHTTSQVWVNYLSSVFGEFWLVSDNKRDKKLCTSCLMIMV